jgi:hypothetical protein
MNNLRGDRVAGEPRVERLLAGDQPGLPSSLIQQAGRDCVTHTDSMNSGTDNPPGAGFIAIK